jgi:hypothetical protein
MNSFKSIAVVLLCGSSLLLAQHKKKPAVSAIFQNAHYVYVQAQDGDITNPRLFPEDRQAISDVEDAIRDWHRYTLAINSSQADLIIIVRKGRLAGLQGHGGISAGPHPMPPIAPGGQNPSQNPSQNQDADQIGGRAEVGPDSDLLRVYGTNPEGRRIGPIWTGEQADGLGAPDVPLLQQLRSAVERAYPDPPQPQLQPTKP